jgi:glucuronosyltransferase
MQETVSRGVPIVGIPVYGDQALNVIRRVSAGFGTLLDLRNITTGSVTWAIKKVLENPRY